MARAIISSILESQLGKYVDGLSGDSLQVGIWSGELSLQDLALKTDALEELELPVSVIRGSVKKLHVQVPWNHLGSSSVQVTLEGVTALVAPKTELPTDEQRRRAHRSSVERQELLRQHQRMAAQYDSHGDDESTFFTRLSARIIDNLQITVKDIHIRYEDRISNPSIPFACGMMLETVSFHTTDADGKETFIDRSTILTKFMHKILRFSHFSIYWDRVMSDTDAELIQTLPAKQIEATLIDMLSNMTEASSPGDTRNWMIHPMSLAVQFTKNESRDYSAAAKYAVTSKVEQIRCKLSREQYEDMVFLQKAFAGRQAIESHFFHAHHRPLHPPKRDPKAWWDYAVLLAHSRSTSQNLSLNHQVQAPLKRGLRVRWTSVKLSGEERRKYIAAFKEKIRHQGVLDVHSDANKQLQAYEDQYPIDVIMAVRDVAEDEEQREAAKRKEEETAHSGGQGKSWYDYFFGSTEQAASQNPEETLLTAEGKKDLQEAYDEVVSREEAEAVPSDCNLLSVKLQLLEGSVELVQKSSQTDAYMLKMTLDGSLEGSVRPSYDWDTQLRVQRFQVLNGCAKDTAFHSFCHLTPQAEQSTPSAPCVDLSVRLNRSEDKDDLSTLRLRLTCMPLQVMIDPAFVMQVGDFFMSVMQEEEIDRMWTFATSSVSDWIFSQEAEEELFLSTMLTGQQKLQYDVLVDLQAPVLVVPEMVQNPKTSVVLLDLGKFTFQNEEAPVLHDKVETLEQVPHYHWRMEVNNIRVLLGTLNQFDGASADASYGGCDRVLEELSVSFGVRTLGLTPTERRVLSRTKNLPLDKTPNVTLQATIPQISVVVNEQQLTALARIHSSIMAASAKQNQNKSPPRDVETNVESTELSIGVSEHVATSRDVSHEAYLWSLELSIKEVQLRLRESAEQDAFVVKVVGTAFAASIFSNYYTFGAKLQSLHMQDKLYDASSKYHELISTGDAEDTHLVSVDVVAYPQHQALPKKTDVNKSASQMEVDVKFNVLNVQWNPSSMALLYRILMSYTQALQHHMNGVDTRDFEHLFGDHDAKENDGSGRKDVDTTASEAQQSLPLIYVRASLVQFSVTFNKDDQDRQLLSVSLNDTNATVYMHECKDSDEMVFKVDGSLGNIVATDLSMAKDSFYSPLLGLTESASDEGSSKALISFTYTHHPSNSIPSFVCLDVQPVRVVYFHQQILELVDYLFEGILGAMLSQTLMNATQLLLSEQQGSVTFQVSAVNSTVILPLQMEERSHIKLTTETFELEHYPLSAIHYYGEKGGEVERVKEVVFDQALDSAIQRSDTCISVRADCKKLRATGVNVYCTTLSSDAMGKVQYKSVLANPLEVGVHLEDLFTNHVTLDDPSPLPRFNIACSMSDVALEIMRDHYLMFVALIQQNFGADDLPNEKSEDEATDRSLSPTRPNINYMYSRTDMEDVTLHVAFTTQHVRCKLLEEVITSSRTDDAFQQRALVELTATNLDVALSQRNDADPTVCVCLGAFVVQDAQVNTARQSHENDAVASLLQSESKEQSDTSDEFLPVGTLAACTEEAKVVYTWNEDELHCHVDIQLNGMRGVAVPKPLLGIVDFFMLPHKSSDKDDAKQMETDDPEDLFGVADSSNPKSVTKMLTEADGPEFVIAISLAAKRMSVALPQEAYSRTSPQIMLGADCTLRGTINPESKRGRSKANTTDLDVQSSLVADAKGIQVYLQNVQRLVGPNGTSEAKIQILEPCDLHVDVNDLFPNAGQRQQIVALKFSPIEVYLSYQDVCTMTDTLQDLTSSINEYESIKQQASVLKRQRRHHTLSSPSSRSKLIKHRSSQPEEMETPLELHRYFTCEVESMTLTLINDCGGCDMGLAQLEMQRGNFFLNVNDASTEGLASVSGGGALTTIISYYSPDTRKWHPMCSEWTLEVSVQGTMKNDSQQHDLFGSSDSELHIILTANQPLDMIVTHQLLEVVASAGGAWKRRHDTSHAALRESLLSPANDEKKMAPCVLQNDTGLEIRYWLMGDKMSTEPQVLPNKGIGDVHYIHRVGRGSGVVRKYSLQERTENLSLCLELLGSDFQPLFNITFEELGSRPFQLVHNTRGQSQYVLNGYSKLVDGRIVLSLSSPVKLVSKLSISVDMLVNDPSWHAPVEVGTLVPLQETAIPLKLSLGSELRVRPSGSDYAWSAPIPTQTHSVSDLQVEATAKNQPKAVFCVSTTIEQSLRVISISEPIVLLNKLPVPFQFRLKSAVRQTQNIVESPKQSVEVGDQSGVWWSDATQRPQFALHVQGCRESRWLQLTHAATKTGQLLSEMLKRDDGRSFKLFIQVLSRPGKAVHIVLYAPIWFVNRTGLELIYGGISDREAYLPPYAARARVGNAEISAFSTAGNDEEEAPVVRMCMDTAHWSSRFTADPRKLSWQDECLTLRSGSVGRDANMLYELGVSADYATRHFGSITTLVSVIPRYLLVNRTPHTVLLYETMPSSGVEGLSGDAAHHILARGDSYALYWATGRRSQLRASVITDQDYGWTDVFSVNHVATMELKVPALNNSGERVGLQVTVKRGTMYDATFVVAIDLMDQEGSEHGDEEDVSGWDKMTFHSQIAGMIFTLSDKHNSAGGYVPTARSTQERVARLGISQINSELTVSSSGKQGKLNVMSMQIDDLLPRSKYPTVLRPVRSIGSEYFLAVSYVEKPHSKYTWVERLHVSVQEVHLATSMRFVDRLNALAMDTLSHFERRSLSSMSNAASAERQDRETDKNILSYFAVSSDEARTTGSSNTPFTGHKVYIEHGVIEPLRVRVSFTKDGGSDGGSYDMGFWLSNLKVKIDDASIRLDEYKLSHALATQEALVGSLSTFYEKSVKSQALGLIESIQVTSLVSSVVTGGVSSIVSTIMGKADPSLGQSASGVQFTKQSLSNRQILQKHSYALDKYTSSSTDFLQQVQHLVFDWDSNHTGLEARVCVALGILNNSRKTLAISATLSDGAELHVLPAGKSKVSGVRSSAVNAEDGAQLTTWSSDRAVVVFAWGYTPTFLTSGDVYFTVRTSACDVYATRKTARIQQKPGYTAAFTHQEAQSWWAANVLIIGDELNSSLSSSRSQSTSDDPHDLFGDSEASASRTQQNEGEYEVTFRGTSLGILAQQDAAGNVVVKDCVDGSEAASTGRISQGDYVLQVAGQQVISARQFVELVRGSRRPVTILFRSSGDGNDTADTFDLFGAGSN